MGAFWNPNVGIMISGRSLSKKRSVIINTKMVRAFALFNPFFEALVVQS
jgi:hypothetical protein